MVHIRAVAYGCLGGIGGIIFGYGLAILTHLTTNVSNTRATVTQLSVQEALVRGYIRDWLVIQYGADLSLVLGVGGCLVFGLLGALYGRTQGG